MISEKQHFTKTILHLQLTSKNFKSKKTSTILHLQMTNKFNKVNLTFPSKLNRQHFHILHPVNSSLPRRIHLVRHRRHRPHDPLHRLRPEDAHHVRQVHPFYGTSC